MNELSAFQDAFSRLLDGEAADLSPWLDSETAEAGLSVYRNTATKSLVDEVLESFPTVLRTVGEDWLAGAARAFAHAHPPGQPAPAALGELFPDWLARFKPAAELPYLTTLARLDWFWLEAYRAADVEPLPGAAFITLLAPQALARTRAVLHPSVRVGWFSDNAPEIWRLTRPPAEPPAEMELTDTPHGLLLARPGLEVQAHPIGPEAFAFLSACARGRSLADSAAAALAADGGSGAGLERTFADLAQAGAFARLEPVDGATRSMRLGHENHAELGRSGRMICG